MTTSVPAQAERMQEPAASAGRRSSRARAAASRALLLLALVVLCSAFLPALPIFLGVFLLVAVGLHVCAPDLRAFVEVCLPLARVAGVRKGLLLTASAGLLLILGGSLGATIGGHLRSEREHRERERAQHEERWSELLERARGQLAAGDVNAAELTLMEAGELASPTVEGHGEVEELLQRVSRSGDAGAILDILSGLPPQEFRALEEGGSVPPALDFGDPALTTRALRLALALIDEARERRAKPGRAGGREASRPGLRADGSR